MQTAQYPLFQEFLAAQDFTTAVQELVQPIRKKFDLPPVRQLGLVVQDVATAARFLEDRGIGPFFLASGKPSFWHEQGEEKQIKGRLGLAYHHNLELELLEPVQGSDFYSAYLDPKGRIVLQHLGFVVQDLTSWINKLQSVLPVYIHGQLKSGPMTTDFAYLTPLPGGLIIEFIEWSFFGMKIKPIPFLVHTLGKLQKLSGNRVWPL